MDNVHSINDTKRLITCKEEKEEEVPSEEQKSNVARILYEKGYTLIKEIGVGSYGKVYKIRQKDLHFAVKVFRITITNEDIYDATALRESHFSSLLNHPHIIGCIDFFVEEFYAFLIMELAKADLSLFLRDGITSKQKVRTIYKIASALDYIHRGGFVHCDLKPNNILVVDDEPKLADFGFMRCQENRRTRFQKKSICQSTNYRSPEQLALDMSLPTYIETFPEYVEWSNDDLRSEYWSLGILCLDIIYNAPYITWNDLGRAKDNLQAIYPEFIEMIVKNIETDSIYETIIKKYGIVVGDSQTLLQLVCRYLLVINPKHRNLRSFMEDDLFEECRFPLVLFEHPTIIQNMYQEGGIVLKDMVDVVNIMKSLYKIGKYPLITTMHSIDYIIQHAHHVHDQKYVRLFIICTFWIMEHIYNARYNTVSMIDYLRLVRGKYTKEQFYEMVLTIMNEGFVRFESLYDCLPCMELAVRGLTDIFESPLDYIQSGTPRETARRLFAEYFVKDQKKNNYLSHYF